MRETQRQIYEHENKIKCCMNFLTFFTGIKWSHLVYMMKGLSLPTIISLIQIIKLILDYRCGVIDDE